MFHLNVVNATPLTIIRNEKPRIEPPNAHFESVRRSTWKILKPRSRIWKRLLNLQTMRTVSFVHKSRRCPPSCLSTVSDFHSRELEVHRSAIATSLLTSRARVLMLLAILTMLTSPSSFQLSADFLVHRNVSNQVWALPVIWAHLVLGILPPPTREHSPYRLPISLISRWLRVLPLWTGMICPLYQACSVLAFWLPWARVRTSTSLPIPLMARMGQDRAQIPMDKTLPTVLRLLLQVASMVPVLLAGLLPSRLYNRLISINLLKVL